MAFFCTVSGVRIISPGVSKGAGGTIPEFDESESHEGAERAARAVLEAMRKSPDEVEPSPEAVKAAETAAVDHVTAPPKKADKAPVK